MILPKDGKLLRLSSDLPIVVEIVDTEEKIESFLPLIDDAVGDGLATGEKVEIRFYRSGGSGGSRGSGGSEEPE